MKLADIPGMIRLKTRLFPEGTGFLYPGLTMLERLLLKFNQKGRATDNYMKRLNLGFREALEVIDSYEPVK